MERKRKASAFQAGPSVCYRPRANSSLYHPLLSCYHSRYRCLPLPGPVEVPHSSHSKSELRSWMFAPTLEQLEQKTRLLPPPVGLLHLEVAVCRLGLQSSKELGRKVCSKERENEIRIEKNKRKAEKEKQKKKKDVSKQEA